MIKQEQVEIANIEEMTNGLCLAGESCFIRGDFRAAMDLLLRCVRTSGSEAIRQAQAKSYHILGLIYGYLGQEIISKENLLKALKLSMEGGFHKEIIQCYVSLAFFNGRLGDQDTALEYQILALEMLKEYRKKHPEAEKDTEVILLAYRGKIYIKQGRLDKSIELLSRIEELTGEACEESVSACVLNLAVQTAYMSQNKDKLNAYLKQMLELPILEEGFFERLEFYFDVCEFLLEKNLREEVRMLLDYIKGYYDMIPLAYLKYDIQRFEFLYAKQYGDEEEYWQAAQNLFAAIPEYEAEQQRVKAQEYDYIEYLHEERDLSAKMEQKSKLDPMTGLFNKFSIEALVDEYFSQHKKDSCAAMLILDMDHFKQINDTLGHLAGDAILTDTASVIRHFFKGGAFCGRLGGDEFMVFVKDVKDISSVLLQAEFLRQEIGRITIERNISIPICASVGVAISTAGYHDYASIYAAADEALYKAKKQGRNKICVIE